MAARFGILGQCAPGPAGSLLFRSPADGETASGLFVACNRNAAGRTARYATLPAGVSTPADMHWGWYDVVLPANDTATLGGITLAPGEAIWVAGQDNTVSFTLHGEVRNA